MNIREIISNMTLEDKIAICSGENFWTTKAMDKYGLPAMFMCDGPSGLRKQEIGESTSDMLGINNSRKATCFPAAVTSAATWNPELLQKLGKALGEEARDQKVGMVLGPGVNIKRNPLCGRNFEYFSEDPYLAGKLAAGFIRGLEGEGVACSMKHFACNSQEKDRFTSDSVIDERTLREIYLKAFEIAVKEAHPSTVMSAYPKINGVHCSDNRWLLTDVLREQWGFDGLVVTDWGGMNDRIEAMKAGNDLMMPGGSNYMEKELVQAVKKGTLDEEDINKCVERILSLVLKETEILKEEYKADYRAHHKLAVKVAREGAVLLKNDERILPLSKEKKIVVVGYMAENVRYQGAGSSHVNPMDLHQPIDYFNNCEYAVGCNERGDTSEQLLAEVAEKTKEADCVLVFAGLPDRYESEGFDRENMKMPEGHVRMIETAAANNPNTVVILMCGAAVECDWADKVKGILYMGLAGEGSAEAAHDLVYGKVNPSGKLAESWPFRYEDVVSSPYYAKKRDALYLEGIYVGYRYYDKAGKEVRWPFGYGLSYTEFEYSDLSVDGMKVSLSVTNKGTTDGQETVQLYVHQLQNDVYRPVRELKRFKKVFVKAGGTVRVDFELNNSDFAIWDNGWKTIGGKYLIEIGKNVNDLPLSAELPVEGEKLPSCNNWYGKPEGAVCETLWEQFFGIDYQEPKLVKGKFTMENTVAEMKDLSVIMKIMYKATESVIAKGFGGKADYDDPDFRMMMNASAGGPLRSMKISGGMKNGVMEGMLEMANGHFIKGILTMIKG